MNEITRIINKRLRYKTYIEDFSYCLIRDDKNMYVKIDVDYTNGKFLSKLIDVDSDKIEVVSVINFILNYYYEN